MPFEKVRSWGFRYVFSFTFFYFLAPKIGVFERSIMERSGYTQAEHPWMFRMLYDWNTLICLTLFSIYFAYAMFRWRKSKIKY